MQRDPAECTDGLGLYSYAHSSPVSRFDPSGMDDYEPSGKLDGLHHLNEAQLREFQEKVKASIENAKGLLASLEMRQKVIRGWRKAGLQLGAGKPPVEGEPEYERWQLATKELELLAQAISHYKNFLAQQALLDWWLWRRINRFQEMRRRGQLPDTPGMPISPPHVPEPPPLPVWPSTALDRKEREEAERKSKERTGESGGSRGKDDDRCHR